MSLDNGLLAEFGNSLGISGLRWPESGSLAIRFESRGTLYLEEREDTLLVYLVRELDAMSDRKGKILRNALRLCHYKEGYPFPVQTGLFGESRLAFLVRVKAVEVTLPELEQILELLTKMHDKSTEIE